MGLSEELSNKLNEIKRNVMRRYKNEKYLALNEELKKTNKKDKKTVFYLNAEIQTLKYNPDSDGQNILSLDVIESAVKNLINEIEEQETSLMNVDRESSMLCELHVQNLINFLKHFNVEINFDDHGDVDDDGDDINNQKKEENEKNKEMIRILNDRCFVLEHNLKQKVSSISFLKCNLLIYN